MGMIIRVYILQHTDRETRPINTFHVVSHHTSETDSWLITASKEDTDSARTVKSQQLSAVWGCRQMSDNGLPWLQRCSLSHSETLSWFQMRAYWDGVHEQDQKWTKFPSWVSSVIGVGGWQVLWSTRRNHQRPQRLTWHDSFDLAHPK